MAWGIMKLGNLIEALIGGLLGVLGFYLYQEAGHAIVIGESLFGFGWLAIDITREEAYAYQMGGIAFMVIGGILLFAALVSLVRK